MEQTLAPQEWLSPADMAGLLGQSIHTVYKWSRRGQPDFPRASRLPNGAIVVSRSDLAAWLDGRAA